MFKKTIISLLILPFLVLFFVQKSFSNKINPPSQHTGALNQPTCGFSNSTNTCHGSTNGGQSVSTLLSLNTDVKLFAGTNEITSSFKYKPDSIYLLTLKVLNPTSLNGFSFTAVKNGQVMASSFTIPPNSQAKLNVQNNDYVNHNGNAGVNEWSFYWAAPAVSNGDVKFHAAINRSNKNNSWSGDEIIPFKVEIAEDKSVGLEKINIENQVKLYSNPILNNRLQFDLFVKEPKKYFISLYDITGKVVFEETRTLHTGVQSLDITVEEKGIYLLNIATNKNEFAQFKLMN